jgi:ubiquinone/menaquinone biosynthesis C-methylase UbiE
VLCVGVGTGNEILRILARNPNIKITGIDYSAKALKKAAEKALRQGKTIQTFEMDARNLDFKPASFDKVLCIHVMDFIENQDTVTGEIFRVLKKGGQFVITYPSTKENVKSGFSLFKNTINFRLNSGGNRFLTLLKGVIQMLVSIVYLPLFLRSKRKSYTYEELNKMVNSFGIIDFQIEEKTDYWDYIVSGIKQF